MNSISTEGRTPEPAIFNVSQIDSLPITAVQQATHTDKVLSVVYGHIIKDWPFRVDDNLSTFFVKKDDLTLESGCIL